MSEIVRLYDELLVFVLRRRPDLHATYKKNLDSITDALCKLSPLPSRDEILNFIAEWLHYDYLSTEPTNRIFAEWLHNFKEGLSEVFPDSSRSQIQCPVGRLLHLCGGSRKNRNHVYRMNSVWSVFVNLGLITEKNERLPLKKLLPKPEHLTERENSCWKNYLVAFTIRMYYYRIMNMLVDFERCCYIRDFIQKWEYQAGGESTLYSRMFGDNDGSTDRVNLPSQQWTFPILVKIMPHPEVVFGTDDEFTAGMVDWAATMSDYVITGLRQCPIISMEDYVAMNDPHGDSDQDSSISSPSPCFSDHDFGASFSYSHDESLGYVSEEGAETVVSFRYEPYGVGFVTVVEDRTAQMY